MAAGDATALAAVALAGAFQGIAAFHLFGHPVPYYRYRDAATGELLREFRRVYHGSLRTVAPLSAVATLVSATAAYLHRAAPGGGLSSVALAFGVAALAQFAESAFSALKIMPLDNTLVATAESTGTKGASTDEEARSMLQRWGRLHAVRVALSGVAVGGALWGLGLLLQQRH